MRQLIETAWEDRSLLSNSETIQAIETVIKQAESLTEEWLQEVAGNE
jgi:hypothetical protein